MPQQDSTFGSLYYGGGWQAPRGSGLIPVSNPFTEEVLTSVPEGTAEDADLAVVAAAAAFPAWAATSVAERRRLLLALAEGLAARQEEIALTIAAEVGVPKALATAVQAGLPIATMRSYAELLDSYPFEEKVGNSLVWREPVGVVAAITPWNFPLHQIVAKVAPALAAGNTVVLKPSELAPMNAYILAELVHEAGLPAGVFNLVTGYGPVVGERLASHPLVDMVSFTGSTAAGRRVAELAAPTVKRVAQELGGKSATLVLDDADFDRAVRGGLNSCFYNSGQTCSACTRLLVPAGMEERAVEVAVYAAQRFTLGDPLAPSTKLGPLISARQRERVRGYIQVGIDEGARLVTGGAEAPAGLDRGYFVAPTVFAGVKPEMRIAREEIFGPVLSILTYRDEEEAIAIANDSAYGLGGAVWSKDQERALRVARRLRTGQVDVNGARYNPQAPFGGYKQSGNGREFGRFGLEEYLETKAVQL
jgi:aldehyde dehydrogenase (NAD+)